MIANSKAELSSVLVDLINKSDGIITIQAGHFALIHDVNGKAVPAIFQDLKDGEKQEATKNNPYMGYFPLETWKFGIELLKTALSGNKKAKVVIIVNDWQWIKGEEADEANVYRDEFYNTAQLPLSYEKELKQADLGEDVILPFRKKSEEVVNKYFFSEKKLRNQFSRHYAATCPLDNKCAQEYIPLLTQLKYEDVKLLISFVPETCMDAVNTGSQRAKQSYDMADLKIVNIFANGIFRKDFWERVNVSII